MAYDTIYTDRTEEGVVTITINRPEVRNAINRMMVGELHDCLGGLERDESVRALVLASEGGKAFVSGADIAELRDRRREDALQGINATLFARLERFPRPTLAAIVGWCLGGGLELALACDFRVAGETSKFGQPEVGLGIMAAGGGCRRLPALIGLAQARRLLFTGEVIDSVEARTIGLIDLRVPNDEVRFAALQLLAPILRQAPEAVRSTKRALLSWVHGAREEELQRLDNELQGELFEHPDKFARMDAFLMRRARR